MKLKDTSKPAKIVSLLPVLLMSLFIMSPLSARAASECSFADIAMLATNSVDIDRNTSITGDIVVNQASSGPTLVPDYEAVVDKDVLIENLKADSVNFTGPNILVSGNVYCNEAVGVSCSNLDPLPLPIFDSLPAFQTFAAHNPPPLDVPIAANAELLLTPGDHGNITMGENAVLRLSGEYNIHGSLISETGIKIIAVGPSIVRIQDRLEIGSSSMVGPEAGTEASDLIFYVAGSNELPNEIPPAVNIGKESTIFANFYALNGTVRVDRNTDLTGSIIGKDIKISRGTTVSGQSAFVNLPPTAFPQTVFTNGLEAITLTLEGNDPEGGDLTFMQSAGPAAGTLGLIVPVIPDPVSDPERGTTTPPISSATVDYTPTGPDNVVDSFVFKVEDPCGDYGMATVNINPPGDPTTPPNPIDTVAAFDESAETGFEVPVQIILKGEAPCDGSCDGIGDDVPLTFSIESNPTNGSLTGLTQGTEDPQRSAEITYTPNNGFSGVDSFVFKVCGVITVEVCDTATVNVNVFGELATDQFVEALQDTPQPITLGATFGAGSTNLASLGSRSSIQSRAATLLPSSIAGNTADADGNGAGDNHNDLPGPAPVLMAAAVDATGGPGSNGIKRMHIEWDISGQSGLADELEGAEVILSTTLGTVDSLDTRFFYFGSNGDGVLTDSDFETDAEEIQGVVMPVPDAPTGTDGTFTFDVTEELRSVLKQGLDYFIIQGRVDESLAGQGFLRGLQVRTTADGNLPGNLQPQLGLFTPGVTPPLFTFSITTLPLNGVLFDANGNLITSPTVLSGPNLTYLPDPGFSGDDSFGFQVEQFGGSTDIGLISINVIPTFGLLDPCVIVGRDPGCGVD